MIIHLLPYKLIYVFEEVLLREEKNFIPEKNTTKAKNKVKRNEVMENGLVKKYLIEFAQFLRIICSLK